MADELDNLEPCEPGGVEWHRRVSAHLRQEESQPYRWWYLSYADDTGFRGAVVVRARGFIGATMLANSLRISPGGECRGQDFRPECVPAAHLTNRLLTMEDLKREFGEENVVRWE